MFALDWYVYPVIAVTVFMSMMLSYSFERWREERSAGASVREDGPCLVHVGTMPDQTNLYCAQLAGHVGPCGVENILMSTSGDAGTLKALRDIDTSDLNEFEILAQLHPGSTVWGPQTQDDTDY